MDKPDNTRRTLLKQIAIVPLAGLFLHPTLGSAANPRIDAANDPQAKALGYMNKSNQDGKSCANCLLWKGGNESWGACNLFAGRDVSREGFCNAWAGAQPAPK